MSRVFLRMRVALAAVVLAFLLSAGCIGQGGPAPSPSPAANPSQSSDALGSLVLSASVAGCAASGAGASEKAISRGEPDRLEVFVNGSQIAYSRHVNHACCRTVNVTHSGASGVVTFVENWTGDFCRCACASNVTASVGAVPPGSYLVRVYETGVGADGSFLPEKLLAEETVRVG